MWSRKKMISRGKGWSVFEAIKPFPPTPNPEALMSEIEAAIAASELAHSTALLSSSKSLSPRPQPQLHRLDEEDEQDEEDKEKDPRAVSANIVYDARLADESYKAACAALTSDCPDAAVRSLRIAIASCPPDKTSALSKLRSLLSIAVSQQIKQQQQQK